VSDWEQFTISFPGPKDDGGAYFKIDRSDPSNPTVYMGKLTGLLRQYFRYIRPGAVRVEAISSDDRYDPVGFINKNGKWVVVIQTSVTGDVILEGLPRGEYAISFGNRNSRKFSEQDVPYANPFVVQFRDGGVLTVFQK
jgi:hypothetical protein